jgi:hypothetical protein
MQSRPDSKTRTIASHMYPTRHWIHQPPGTIVAVPPQGAPAPGPYAAADLGSRVADELAPPFAEIVSRTDVKRGPAP